MKKLRLRRPDQCWVCSTGVAAGESAWWDRDTQTVTCVDCAQTSNEVEPKESVAGGSAQREYDRRRQRHIETVEQRWGTGTIGAIAKAVTSEPQSTTAWAKGAEGERRLSAHLRRELNASCVVLDDRQIPGTRANIDHLVVADSGVWIVDAKNYSGKVKLRVSGWKNPITKLFVAGRDRSRLIGGMGSQHAAVSRALGAVGEPFVPIHSVICFTNADWPLVGGTGMVDGVWVGHAPKLVRRIAKAEVFQQDLASRLANQLAHQLPPA